MENSRAPEKKEAEVMVDGGFESSVSFKTLKRRVGRGARTREVLIEGTL